MRRSSPLSMSPVTCLRVQRDVDRLATAVHGMLARGLEPLLPVECVVCRSEAVTLCRSCRRMLNRATAHPTRVEHGARHARGLPIVAAGPYEHELATCLLAMKQAGRTDLLPLLAPVLARAVRAAVGDPRSPATARGAESAQPVELVPIPTSAKALRRRWYDPVGELLSACGRQSLLPAGVHVTPWLVHRSRDLGWGPLAPFLPGGRPAPVSGTTQKARSAAERGAASRASTYRVARGRVAGDGRRATPGRVVLIDDVVTTGATLSQAHRVLRQAGAHVLGAVVLAATHTPSGSEDLCGPTAGARRRIGTGERPDKDEFAV